MPRKYSIRLFKPKRKDDSFCNDAYASELWTNGGVQDADLVLYVTANATKACHKGALAYTLPCLTDLVTGRPIAAGMNICPLSQKSSPRRLLNTIVHETVHALVSRGQQFFLLSLAHVLHGSAKQQRRRHCWHAEELTCAVGIAAEACLATTQHD